MWYDISLLSGSISMRANHETSLHRNVFGITDPFWGESTGHKQQDCSLNRLFGLTIMKPSKFRIGPCEENQPVDSPHKRSIMRKAFSCHAGIMATHWKSCYVVNKMIDYQNCSSSYLPSHWLGHSDRLPVWYLWRWPLGWHASWLCGWLAHTY